MSVSELSVAEQLVLVVLGIAIAVNAALIVAFVVIVRSRPASSRPAEEQASSSTRGALDRERRPREPVAIVPRLPALERDSGSAALDRPVPLGPSAAEPADDPVLSTYEYRFGAAARAQPADEQREEREPEDVAPPPSRPSRSGLPRRFQVVLHQDPGASRAIQSFISDPVQGGANGDSRRGSGRGDAAIPPAFHTDDLTGLLAHAAWDALLADEEARLDRYRRSVTVLFADLDGLTRLAEHFGPGPTERIVREISGIFRDNARSSDRVARIGPGLFGVLLAETDERGAAVYAARVRTAADAWLESAAVSIRLAMGWASPRTTGGLALAIRTADARLRATEAEGLRQEAEAGGI